MGKWKQTGSQLPISGMPVSTRKDELSPEKQLVRIDDKWFLPDQTTEVTEVPLFWFDGLHREE